LGRVTSTPDALSASEAETVDDGDGLECGVGGPPQAPGVQQHGVEVDDGASDVIDVVELLLGDASRLDELGYAFLGMPEQREIDTEVVAGVPLDGTGIVELLRHRDRLTRVRQRVGESPRQHQDLGEPADDGRVASRHGLAFDKRHRVLVGGECGLAVRRHPQIPPQTFVQVGVMVPVGGIDDIDRLPH
jgi:hypothetical protein